MAHPKTLLWRSLLALALCTASATAWTQAPPDEPDEPDDPPSVQDPQSGEWLPKLPPTPSPPLGWRTLLDATRNIRAAPDDDAQILGGLRRGHPFPVYEEAPASGGCSGPWLRVAPSAWACGADTAPTPAPSLDPGPPLPFKYAVTWQDARVHSEPRKSKGTAQIRPKKSTLTVEEVVGEWTRAFPDEWYSSHLLIPRPEREYRLRGELLRPDALPLAFVRQKNVQAWPAPNLSTTDRKKVPKEQVAELRRFERHPILDTHPPQSPNPSWVKLAPGWVLRHQVALVAPQPRPRLVEPHDPWILVDLSEQTLVAYEGDTPVFATLVSTGKVREGKHTTTPTGQWRLTQKLRSTKMAGGEGADYHYLSDVPWVQYYYLGHALHGVYWHNSFGWQQSQGCVNLTPADAQWLFLWTRPTLPPGWYSAHIPPDAPSTWVVVVK